MRSLVGSCIRSRGLVVVLGIGVLIYGAIQVVDLPRDMLPEFGPPTVEVQTEALGLSAQEVEQLITAPLEQDLLNGVAFVDDIRSESLPGLSRIEMVFEPGTDIGRARQVVNERLTQAHGLPNVSKPPQMLQPRSSTSRVMMVGLSSSEEQSLHRARTAGPLDDPPEAHGRLRRGQRVALGPAGAAAAGAGRSATAAGRRGHPRAGHQHDGQRAVGVPPDVPGGVDPGRRRLLSTPPTQRIGVEHTQPIQTPEDLAKTVIEPGPNTASDRAGATPGRRDDDGRGPPAADRRRRRSPTAGACSSLWRSSPRPTSSR